MPLPKPWRLPTPRKLSDEEARKLFETASELAEIEQNNLSKMVEENIKRNRMSPVRLTVYDSSGNELPDADVHAEQVSHDFNFGCNAFLANGFDSKEKNDEYERIFREVFNQAVVPFYWRDDEPIRGHWRFGKNSEFCYRRPPADEMLSFCEKTGCRPKGHNLVWPSGAGIPTWLRSKSEREIGCAIENRLKLISERYAEKIPMWDVTNELTGAAPEVGVLPYDIEMRVWKKANDLFFNNHLIINDYQCLFNQYYKGKMSALYIQTQRLLDSGIRVDGIGMQCHLFHNEDMLCTDEPQKFTAEYMIDMINCYSRLGPVIHISEITIPSYDGRDEYLRLQEMITRNMFKIWFSMEKVNSIVWWNLVDGTAIKASPGACFDENYFGGGLLKSDFGKKPAYDTVERLINKEWHTSVDTHTDKNGRAAFTGFDGMYDVTIKRGGDSYTAQIKVDKREPLKQIILK